eukprot:scaffold632150_cov37-Prasinocladus_malaysianus.AAC.1
MISSATAHIGELAYRATVCRQVDEAVKNAGSITDTVIYLRIFKIQSARECPTELCRESRLRTARIPQTIFLCDGAEVGCMHPASDSAIPAVVSSSA